MSLDEPAILYEDNHLLVVNKPPGLATMGTGDAHTVHAWATDYLRRKYHKPGKVYLGVVHRLDSMASGTLVLARTSKAAARLSEQFRQHSQSLARRPAVTGQASDAAEMPGLRKTYLAVVSEVRGRRRDGVDDDLPAQGTLCDWLVKNEREHCMEARRQAGGGAVEAVLDFRRLDEPTAMLPRGLSALEIQLRTGRKHQVRVQFSSRGYPVWGDAKYGGVRQTEPGIALHAWRLSIVHPTAKTEMTFQSPVPQVWHRWFPKVVRWAVHA